TTYCRFESVEPGDLNEPQTRYSCYVRSMRGCNPGPNEPLRCHGLAGHQYSGAEAYVRSKKYGHKITRSYIRLITDLFRLWGGGFENPPSAGRRSDMDLDPTAASQEMRSEER